jgi:aerobic-type carbon monoxide dehydrogenase small subunit (CoxS/CutS family)
MISETLIRFTVIHSNSSVNIGIEKNEYFSLLTLISEKFQIPGFGLCNGMGSCGTCMVRIKYKGNTSCFYLQACQIACDELLDGAEVSILEVI